jgi:hypothetical protein
VAHGQQITSEFAQRGRAGAGSSGSSSTPRQVRPEDVELNRMLATYDKLGDQPPNFKVPKNDDLYQDQGAHTMKHHGGDVPLRHTPGTRTIEGRLYGDHGWRRRENKSFRWTDHHTMNRTINDYVSRNWETIRSDLAMTGVHRRTFDAGHRIGEGFVNDGMFGAGPVKPRYMTTSFEEVHADLESLAQTNVRSHQRDLAAFEAVIADPPTEPNALAHLVAWDGNWVLDDPSDTGALQFLREVAEMLRTVIVEAPETAERWR